MKGFTTPIVITILTILATFGAGMALLSQPPQEKQTLSGTPVLRPFQGGTGTSTAPSDLQLLVGQESGIYGVRTLTAGSNVTIATSTTALTISATGGSGSGTIGTSTALVDTYVTYATAADTIGAESAFTYDDATNLLSFDYASTTAITATNFYGALTGTASLATALGANGSNCSAGNAPLGVDASGAVESCFDVWTEAENTSAGYISDISSFDTGDLAEGSNLYYTTGRVSSYLYASTTLSDLFTAGTGLSWTGNTINAEVQTSDLHDAVTLAGEDFLSLSTQQITANAINPDNLASADFGDFTCNGTSCSLDATYATSLDTAYNGGASITADGGAVAITVPDTSNNAGLTIAQNDTTNSPVALHIITVDNNSGAGILIENEGDGPTDTAFFDMYQDSASPAIADEIGRIRFLGKDSGGSIVYPYAEILATIADPTNTSEDGTLSFKTISAGASRTKLYMAGSLNGVSVGDSSVGAGVLSSNGNQDLTLQTGNSTTGNITITDGANGNITLDPDGTGKIDLSGGAVKMSTYKSFTWPGTPTTTTATTTVPLGTAYTAEAWNGAECYTTSGTSYLVFTDGTNDMNSRTATTTVGRFTLSTNNTFTASEKRYVEIGALTAAQLSCTVSITINN